MFVHISHENNQIKTHNHTAVFSKVLRYDLELIKEYMRGSTQREALATQRGKKYRMSH